MIPSRSHPGANAWERDQQTDRPTNQPYHQHSLIFVSSLKIHPRLPHLRPGRLILPSLHLNQRFIFHTRTNTHIHTRTHTHTYAHTHTHTRTHTHTHTHAHTHTRTHTHAHTHTHTQTHTQTHTDTHTHRHVYIFSSSPHPWKKRFIHTDTHTETHHRR